MTSSGQNIEIEIKLDLPKEADYQKIVGHLKPFDAHLNQTNAFFDSKSMQLSNAKWALRVRVDDHSGLITLKGKSNGQDGASVREEIESTIERSVALSIIGGKVKLLDLDDPVVNDLKNRFGILSVEQTLQFSNYRQEKTIEVDGQNITFELDKSEFAGGAIEYELEVEVDSIREIEPFQKIISTLFKTLDIPMIHQDKSKFERALNYTGLSPRSSE